MRVLLDESVYRRLKGAFDEEHEVSTVPERGWAGMMNSELLEAAGKEFDAFVTTRFHIYFMFTSYFFGVASERRAPAVDGHDHPVDETRIVRE